MKIKHLLSFIKDPVARFDILSSRGLLGWMDDETYIKKYYRIRTGKKLNLKNPQTYNEKLQWLKLHDRKDIYTKMVDKYEVKEYVAKIIGEKYIIPTYGVWDNFDDINFNTLPEQFVLKCTHDSGGLIIVKDKSKLDMQAARKKIMKCLKRNYYSHGREWPYKNVKPRIIAEKYMEEKGINTEEGLRDYKIFCFDGEPKLIQVDYNRFDNHKRNLYTTDWNYVEASIKYPTDPNHQIAKPTPLNEMLDVARKLSQGMPHLRVDLYCVEDKVYFGELTLCHGTGMETFSPESLGIEMGKWLKLPQ